MKRTQLLKLAKKAKSSITELTETLVLARYKVISNEDGTYTIKSGATGATLYKTATEGDLAEMVRNLHYINERHGAEILSGKYTVPVHGLAIKQG